MRTLILHGARRARFAVPLAIAGAVALLAAGPAPADDRFHAGQAGVSRRALDGRAAAPMAARARAHAVELGLPTGVRRTVTRVTDRFQGTTYVDVTALDSAGEPLSLARYGPDGRLRTAIRFGWRGPTRAVAIEVALRRARTFARTAGLKPVGAAAVRRTADGGFRVAWPRTADGIPVRGDGLTVALWADGTLHSLATQERTLAEAPARRLSADDARSRASSLLGDWLPQHLRASARVDRVDLAWIAPNDMFEPSGPDAPASMLRLAWVVTVRAGGPLADTWRQLEIHLDAGDGRLLGGDILR